MLWANFIVVNGQILNASCSHPVTLVATKTRKFVRHKWAHISLYLNVLMKIVVVGVGDVLLSFWGKSVGQRQMVSFLLQFLFQRLNTENSMLIRSFSLWRRNSSTRWAQNKLTWTLVETGEHSPLGKGSLLVSSLTRQELTKKNICLYIVKQLIPNL